MYQKHKLQNIKNYTFVTFYFPVTTGVILTIILSIVLHSLTILCIQEIFILSVI